MAFIPVPDTAEVDIIGELWGQLIENTLYFVTDGGWIESSLIQLATSVAQWATTELIDVFSEDYTMQRVEARDISTQSGFIATNTTDMPIVGGTADTSMPGNVAACVSFRTNLAGRSFRGRNFVSGVPIGNCSGNQINADYYNSLVAKYLLLPGMVTDDLPDAVWCVVSRYADLAPRTAGVTTPIESVIYTNRDIDSQRRRLTGRGE